MTEQYERCLRCNRKLKTHFAKVIGYGKVCWEKFNSEDNFQKLFEVGDNSAHEQFNDDVETTSSS